MKATPIEINWHTGLPIFASELFLKAVGDDYGWLGGIDDKGELRCLLPYTIIRKPMFQLVRFRVETVPLGGELSLSDENAFLNAVIEYFRFAGADMIIPATTNTVFRTYPDGADAAPYGSYIIDLCQSEDVLWQSINRITRQNINTARKKNVRVCNAIDRLDEAYALISDTFKRSKVRYMSREAFGRYVHGLGDNCRVMVADYEGIPQSYVVFAFSDYCAYAVYAGNIPDQLQGANKLLYWEAIRSFKGLGVRRYDFVGARINPAKGSKAEAINSLKKRFGSKLVQGYMWKYPFNQVKYRIYGFAASLRSNGDIVDAERHKLGRHDGISSEEL